MNLGRKLKQIATVWQGRQDDGWGNFTYTSRKAIPVRWEDKAVLFLDRATGSEIVSQAVIWTLPTENVLEGEMIALGDHTAQANPYTVGAKLIKNVSNTPDLKGAMTVTQVMV